MVRQCKEDGNDRAVKNPGGKDPVNEVTKLLTGDRTAVDGTLAQLEDTLGNATGPLLP